METEFKATKENLLALVEVASNTKQTGDFVEADEIMNLSDHPLRNEIMERIESGEIVFS